MIPWVSTWVAIPAVRLWSQHGILVSCLLWGILHVLYHSAKILLWGMSLFTALLVQHLAARETFKHRFLKGWSMIEQLLVRTYRFALIIIEQGVVSHLIDSVEVMKRSILIKPTHIKISTMTSFSRLRTLSAHWLIRKILGIFILL